VSEADVKFESDADSDCSAPVSRSSDEPNLTEDTTDCYGYSLSSMIHLHQISCCIYFTKWQRYNQSSTILGTVKWVWLLELSIY